MTKKLIISPTSTTLDYSREDEMFTYYKLLQSDSYIDGSCTYQMHIYVPGHISVNYGKQCGWV